MTRGEVWWVEFKNGVKGKIQKTPPAIIMSNNSSNRHLNRLQVIPLTTNTAKVFQGEALIQLNSTTQKAAANQIITVAKVRLTSFIGTLNSQDIRSVEHAIRIQLGLRI